MPDAGFDSSAALKDLVNLREHLAEVNTLVEQETESTWQQARALAPRGALGRYWTAIRSKVFQEADGSVSGKVFVIQLPWIRNLKWQRRVNPNGSMLWPKMLPRWLEFGTSKMRPRPHLIPAFEAGVRRLNAAVERLLGGLAS